MTEVLHAVSVGTNSGCLNPQNALGEQDDIWTSNTGNENWSCTWNLDAPALEVLPNGEHFFRIRLRRSAPGGSAPTLDTVEIRRGGTTIATIVSSFAVPDEPLYQSITLTTQQLSGDLSGLSVYVQASAPGGPQANRRNIQIDAFRFEADTLYTVNFNPQINNDVSVGLAYSTNKRASIASTSTVGVDTVQSKQVSATPAPIVTLSSLSAAPDFALALSDTTLSSVTMSSRKVTPSTLEIGGELDVYMLAGRSTSLALNEYLSQNIYYDVGSAWSDWEGTEYSVEYAVTIDNVIDTSLSYTTFEAASAALAIGIESSLDIFGWSREHSQFTIDLESWVELDTTKREHSKLAIDLTDDVQFSYTLRDTITADVAISNVYDLAIDVDYREYATTSLELDVNVDLYIDAYGDVSSEHDIFIDNDVEITIDTYGFVWSVEEFTLDAVVDKSIDYTVLELVDADLAITMHDGILVDYKGREVVVRPSVTLTTLASMSVQYVMTDEYSITTAVELRSNIGPSVSYTSSRRFVANIDHNAELVLDHKSLEIVSATPQQTNLVHDVQVDYDAHEQVFASLAIDNTVAAAVDVSSAEQVTSSLALASTTSVTMSSRKVLPIALGVNHTASIEVVASGAAIVSLSLPVHASTDASFSKHVGYDLAIENEIEFLWYLRPLRLSIMVHDISVAHRRNADPTLANRATVAPSTAHARFVTLPAFRKKIELETARIMGVSTPGPMRRFVNANANRKNIGVSNASRKNVNLG